MRFGQCRRRLGTSDQPGSDLVNVAPRCSPALAKQLLTSAEIREATAVPAATVQQAVCVKPRLSPSVTKLEITAHAYGSFGGFRIRVTIVQPSAKDRSGTSVPAPAVMSAAVSGAGAR